MKKAKQILRMIEKMWKKLKKEKEIEHLEKVKQEKICGIKIIQEESEKRKNYNSWSMKSVYKIQKGFHIPNQRIQ